MAFIKVEDFEHTYEAVVFGSVFPKIENKLQSDALVLMQGRLNSALDDPVIKIICEEAYELEAVPGKLTDSIMLRVDKSAIDQEKITYLKNTLASHKGKTPIFFRVSVNGKDEINMVSKKVKVSVNMSLINELEKILSLENIKIKVKTR